MASVKKFPSSANWYACFRGADGKRKQVATQKTDRDDALAVAVAYERAASDARAGKMSASRAHRFLAECRLITGSSHASIPVDEWLTDWAKKTGRRLKPKSATRYTAVIDHFLAFLGAERKSLLWSIQPVQIATWRDDFIARGRAPKTANIAVAILAQAFREAHKLQLCEGNPCDGLLLTNADNGNTARRPFTLEQFSALLAAAPDDDWRLFLLLLGLTGARQQEAAQLRWEAVDLTARTLTLIRGKQRDQPHLLPMHPALFTALDEAQRRAASLFVVPTIAALEGKYISKKFRRQILPRIGIVQPYASRTGARVAPRYALHSLRHSLATWGDAAGMTPAQRRDLLGHESGLINERYTHSNIMAIAAALARITVAVPARKPDRPATAC